MKLKFLSTEHNGGMQPEYSENDRALDHLEGCVLHIQALPDLIEKYRDVPHFYQAFIESYLVNYRLLFEFVDNKTRSKDFSAKTFLQNWTYSFSKEAQDIYDLSSQFVVHFSKKRQREAEAKKVFSTDPASLKKLNELLSVPYMQFMTELLESSIELGA